MGFAIIQLSDIHIKDNDDLIVKRIDRLKAACNSKVNPNDDVLILISGDIAYSGTAQQYNIAEELLSHISCYLEEQKKCKIHYAFVPGNHDCDFTVSNSVRESLLTGIDDNSDADIFYTVNSVQKNYQEFVKKFYEDTNELIQKKVITVDNKEILLVLINSAWMSCLSEKPGKIIIPKFAFPNINNEKYKMVITIQHHPVNWFNTNFVKEYNEFVRTTTDLLFVGHEHQKDGFSISSNKWMYSEFHAKELQDSYSDSSEFAVYVFDDSFDNYKAYQYEWLNEKNAYDVINEELKPYHKNPSTKVDTYYPNEQTMELFDDPGININHFAKDNVTLRDIYVWPDVNKTNIRNETSNDIIIRKGLFTELENNNLSIISGNNIVGKSSLGKMLFLSYADNERCCLFIDGKDFTSENISKIEKVIKENYIKQYSEDNYEMFSQLPKEKKIIIIDNFDETKPLVDKRNALLDYILNCFGQVYIFVSSSIQIPQLLSLNCLQELEEIPYYEIRPFGNLKRKELITKWYYLNRALNSPEIDKKIENVCYQVDKLLGNSNSFMPAVPVFLITFLQNIDSANPTTFQGSKYSSLYETLIKENLSKISTDYITSGLFSIDVNMLSTLAYKMLKNKSLTFSESEFVASVQKVNIKQKLEIRPEDLMKRMISNKIFYQEIEGSDIYRFRYPYMYYYFAGYYLSSNAEKKEVSEQIEYMSKKLYNEDYGNIIIFVCHFSNNSDIISTILINAYSILENYEPFVFEDDNPVFHDIQLAIEASIPDTDRNNVNVKKNKEEKLKKLDDGGVNDGSLKKNHDTIDDSVDEKEKDLAALNAAFKTLDVLGQILQNYPGNVDGELKIEMIKEIHDLGMRVVQSILSMIGLLETEFIELLQNEIKDKEKKSRDQLIVEIKKFFTIILSSTIRGMISKIAISLNSEFLLPATTETFEESNKISSKLILAELKMNCLNKFSLNDLKKLDSELSKNDEFARSILKSIVANYLKFNDCNYRMREKLCDQFELDKKNTFISSTKEKMLN